MLARTALALWYAEHSDFVFRVVYGDKECFHLGWRKLGSDYAMPAKAPDWNQHTIQWDFHGQQMFNHRCQDKWKIGGGNRRNNSLANEELFFNLVADLRKRWDGVLWHNPDPLPEEQRVIDELAGRRFMYRRVDHDERPLRLEPARKVGEGAARLRAPLGREHRRRPTDSDPWPAGSADLSLAAQWRRFLARPVARTRAHADRIHSPGA